MHSITPIKLHHEEHLPADPHEVPDYWRVDRVTVPAQDGAKSELTWAGSFPSLMAATRYVFYLEGSPLVEQVSPAQAAEALDSLDDCARMDLGVDAHGPRAVLERFIAQHVQSRLPK